MSNEKLVKIIKLIQKKYNVSSCNLQRYIKNHYPKIYNQIEEKTKKLEKFKSAKNKFRISIFEKIYCLEHNLDDRPLCKTCGKNYVNRFNVQTLEYGKWYSPVCQASDPDCIEKSFKTREEKYGSKTYINVEKSKQTRLEKYGGYCSKDFSEKVKKTKLEHFGDENFVNSEKCKKTKFERYGNENFNNHDKISETKLERYGDENFNNREKFKETISEFSEEKKFEIIEKRIETCKEKYGIDSSLKLDICKANALKFLKKRTYNRFIKLNNFYSPLFTEKDYIENKTGLYKYECKQCGKVLETNIKPWSPSLYFLCKDCHPQQNIFNGTSNAEKEISNFLFNILKNYNIQILNNYKKLIAPFEVDIYIPEKKLAIEYDGLYFHSDEIRDKKYHLNKTLLCKNNNVKLIHIFENEWLTKQPIVKSKLKALCGIYDKIIYARKCEIKKLNYNEAYEFCNNNHLQGFSIAKVFLGLFYNNELVSLMSLSKPRFSKNYEWELARFCNKINYKVVGGASKLLKYFEENYNPKSLVSYADLRWSYGELYTILGFSLKNTSLPAYWYWKTSNKLHHRTEFQKHKLKNILEKFDENLSEYENMRINGYNRIFDCGNLVFVKTY